MLSIQAVHYSTGSKNILNGITISYSPGLFHAIVGPNGSGKSTLLKVFSGEQHLQQGAVTYDGQDIAHLPKMLVARRRSVMSQQPELHFPLRVEEIIMMGRYPHFSYQPALRDREICKEVIRKLDLEAFVTRDYLTLSGGEKQRVQFARTLAQIWEVPHSGSRYLFLDEPISNLDMHYQHQFLELAKQFTGPQTVTIAILHDINLSVQYADTITFIKAGLVASHGVPAQVISPKLIREVFDIPVAIIEHPSTRNPLVVYNG